MPPGCSPARPGRRAVGLFGIPDLRKIKSGLDALPSVADWHARLVAHNWDQASRQLLDAHLH